MVKRTTKPLRWFYIVLGVLAVVGAAVVIWTIVSQTPEGPDVAADTGGPLPRAQGYVLGDPNAPVEIIEFADFECPACAQFATVTEPDVRQRLVETGVARLRFLDFPLPMHPNSWEASNAAACANEQGRFWAMHDAIFQMQDRWAGVRRPKGIFEDLAQQIGLNVQQWEECYDARRYQQQIAANLAEGERRGVSSTPSFIIGGQRIAGAISYDQLKGLVDEARARVTSGTTATTPAAPTAGAPATP